MKQGILRALAMVLFAVAAAGWPAPAAAASASPSPSPSPSASSSPAPSATPSSVPTPAPARQALPAVASGTSHYQPMTPLRLLDTRDGTGGRIGPLGSGEHIDIQVANVGPVPANATAAVLNVAATQPAAGGFLTVYPAGQAWPLASTVNYAAGQTVPNLAIVGIGVGGKVSVINSSPSTHVIVDVQGWYSPAAGNAGLYRAISPARILDTRD